MKRHLILSLVALATLVFSCSQQEDIPDLQNSPELAEKKVRQERVVVCNRASRDISVIDAANNTVIATYPMPDNGEPMYAVHVRQAKRVFVGDRANDRVVAFDEDDFSVEGYACTGAGVFHMWAARNGSQLWVNNDIDNTTTIINPHNLNVIGTANTPADLVALGGKPHDVVVNGPGTAAWVTVLGVQGSNDYVVKYNAQSCQEVGRAAVGKDPHVSFTRFNNFLYVPCQNSNAVYVLRRGNMSLVTTIPFDGAHGAGMANNGQHFYTADLPGNRLGVINTSSNSLVGSGTGTPFPVPHNIALNRTDDKLFLTHSGATADQLSIYDVNPSPNFVTSLTLGTNPFGLVYYSYKK